jgi:hypothetical protein
VTEAVQVWEDWVTNPSATMLQVESDKVFTRGIKPKVWYPWRKSNRDEQKGARQRGDRKGLLYSLRRSCSRVLDCGPRSLGVQLLASKSF